MVSNLVSNAGTCLRLSLQSLLACYASSCCSLCDAISESLRQHLACAPNCDSVAIPSLCGTPTGCQGCLVRGGDQCHHPHRGIPYTSLTRDWISATVNCPDHALEAHKRQLTVCVIKGCQGCMHDEVVSGCYILLIASG